MTLSEPFVRRPVATALIAVAILLAGLAAFRLLPIAPLPRVDFPTIQVNGALPGYRRVRNLIFADRCRVCLACVSRKRCHGSVLKLRIHQRDRSRRWLRKLVMIDHHHIDTLSLEPVNGLCGRRAAVHRQQQGGRKPF